MSSKKIFCLLLLVVLWMAAHAQMNEKRYPKSFVIHVSNPLNASRVEVLVWLDADQLKSVKGFNKNAFIVMDGAKEIPSQYVENDPRRKGIAFVLGEMKSNERRSLTIRYNPKGKIEKNYPKRTQAEISHKIDGEWRNREYIGGTFKNVDFLRVPSEHTDHSWFIRYEGPGWESDKVGYRFYLDQRNATDVFGKKTPAPVMQLVGQDGFDSYHNMQPWGMDVMKVGKSLGVGSIGAMTNGKVTRVEITDSVTCRIAENGALYSAIETNYYGWKIGADKHLLQSVISIHAGTRLTHQYLNITNTADTVCTGIVKDTKANVFRDAGDASRWGYVATYGKQSLNNDNLGLVVFFKDSQSLGFAEDANSHIVLLKPDAGVVNYYFAGVWELEQNGVTNEADFLAYVKAVAQELAVPVVVTLE